MKSSHILLFCVLATASYVFYQQFSIASSFNFLPAGRRHLREWSLPFPKSEYQNIQDGDKEIKRLTMQEVSTAVLEQRSSRKNLEENVYHIDYHGVMTHPTPTPKHPQP